MRASSLARHPDRRGRRRSRQPACGADGRRPPSGSRPTRPKTTVAGNTFVAPAGWSLVVRGPATILEAPEGGSFIVLVDVAAKDVADADAARRGRVGGLQARREVAAQGDDAHRRQGRLDPAEVVLVPDVAEREARRRRRRPPGQRHVDGRDLRHGAGGRREAGGAGQPDLREAAAEGPDPGVVRRQEGKPARRRAPGGAQEVRRDVDEAHGRAGRLRRPLPGRPRRAGRGVRRARARQAREGRRATPAT